MDPIDIKYQLAKKGYSLASVGRRLVPGVSRNAVCNVVNGYGESARIKNLIAKIIGMKVKDIWPDKAA